MLFPKFERVFRAALSEARAATATNTIDALALPRPGGDELAAVPPGGPRNSHRAHRAPRDGTFQWHVGTESPADRPIEDAGKAVRSDAERTVTHALMITVEITRDGRTRYAEVLSIPDANETFISVATTVYVEFGTGERAKPGHRPRTLHPIRVLGHPPDPAWLAAAPERAVGAIVLRTAGDGWRVGPSCPVPEWRDGWAGYAEMDVIAWQAIDDPDVKLDAQVWRALEATAREDRLAQPRVVLPFSEGTSFATWAERVGGG